MTTTAQFLLYWYEMLSKISALPFQLKIVQFDGENLKNNGKTENENYKEEEGRLGGF